ncbi:epoxide hydrolase, soluble (sEH), partial [Nowakowskiella sp. JEL0078]
MQLHSIQTGHKDLIHDIQYNFFGNRACTVSSDQVIKVWNTSTGQNDRQKWELIDSWKAHDASVLKVCWAHPEFGQLIASCSFDRTVKIWEEQDDESSPSQKRWKIVGTLSEDFFAIQDLQFAPNHLGLKLAVVGENGMLRIYEALDVVNVGKWALM